MFCKYKEIVTQNYAEAKKRRNFGLVFALTAFTYICMAKDQKSTLRVTAKKEEKKTQGQDI